MIDVNERWVIDVDERTYMPSLKSSFYRDKKGHEGYVHKVYFTSLTGALKYIAKEEARMKFSQNSRTLTEAFRDIQEIYNEYSNLVESAAKGELWD